jgi:hypothetical protein
VLNPRFSSKINGLDLPEPIKVILSQILTEEDNQLLSGFSQKEVNRYYEKKLGEYLKNKEIATFCDKYEFN